MLHREWFTLKQTILLIDDLKSKGWTEWKRTYPTSIILLTKLEQKDIIFSKASRKWLDRHSYRDQINNYFCVVGSISSAQSFDHYNKSEDFLWREVSVKLRSENVYVTF